MSRHVYALPHDLVPRVGAALFLLIYVLALVVFVAATLVLAGFLVHLGWNAA